MKLWAVHGAIVVIFMWYFHNLERLFMEFDNALFIKWLLLNRQLFRDTFEQTVAILILTF